MIYKSLAIKVKRINWPRVKRIILVIFLVWAIVKSLVASRYQIINETEWIRRFPFASFEEKLRYRTNPLYYDFITFIQKNTPENAVIMIPPQTWPWPFSGHIEYDQYFLYPRRLVKDDRERILSDKGITHIFVNWGEGFMDDERLQGYPKYYMPVKKIITQSGEKALYPARSPYLEKLGLIEIERGENEEESLAGLKPGTAEYYFHRAEFLRANGLYSQAQVELQSALRLKPNWAWIAYVLGDTWEKLGRQDLAAGFYQEAIKNDPNTGWFYYTLGQLYEKEQKEDQAVSYYQKCLFIAPDSVWVSLALGRIYEKRQDLVNAGFFYGQTNFLDWGPGALDSKMGVAALDRLIQENPQLADILVKFKEMKGPAVKKIEDDELRRASLPTLQFIPGVVGQAVLLPSQEDHLVYTSETFFSKEGTIEFYWRPPSGIESLKSGEVVDLLHQLEYWLPRDGVLYLWAGKDYLGFGIFDLKEKTWQLLKSKKVFWQPDKWYQVTIGFGQKGMFLFLDGELQDKNGEKDSPSSIPLFLGGGRQVTLFDFLKKTQLGHGGFDELTFYQYQKEPSK